MLPNVNLTNQNEVSQSEINTSRFQNKLSQVNASLKERMANIASPSMMIQSGVVKTFGNNAMSQAAIQLGGLLTDLFSKRDDAPQEDQEDRRGKHYEVSDTILKEILKTLLRIEKSGSFGSNDKSQLRGKKDRGDWYPIAAHDKIEIEQERKSARDILDRLEKKSPVGRKHINQPEDPMQAHLSNVTANVTAATEQGFYNAFGYNVLTQGATEGIGALEDAIKGIFSSKSKDVEQSEDIGGVLIESKESKNILQKILDTMQDLNKTFKGYFAKKDETISSLETEYESSLKSSLKSRKIDISSVTPAMPPGIKAVPPTPPESGSFLDSLGDVAEIGVGLDHLRKTKFGQKIFDKIGSLGRLFKSPSTWKSVGKGAGVIGLAATPLLAMKGVSDWAGETEHDVNRVESIQENIQSPLESFLSKIGLNFKDRFEKQRQQNRADLDGSEYDQPKLDPINKTGMSWDVVVSPSKSNMLDKSATIEPKSVTQQPNQTTVLNNQTVNNQTIIPTRNTSRNSDSTANRYFNQEFR